MRDAKPGLTLRAAPWTGQRPSSDRARRPLGVFGNSVAAIVGNLPRGAVADNTPRRVVRPCASSHTKVQGIVVRLLYQR
jgi:hypothetical protein